MAQPAQNRDDWENKFYHWSQPPGKTEQERCEHTINMIRLSIHRSDSLRNRNIKVFTQGSFRNRVNVRRDSDVDVGVMCHDVFFPVYPVGMRDSDFGNFPSDYNYGTFKNDLEKALVDSFGRDAVVRGNKAFDVHANTSRVEADVVPLFEYRHYYHDRTYCCGTALRPDHGDQIVNFPERILESWPVRKLHYENGVDKNTETVRRYKGAVRIIKSLRNEMASYNYPSTEPIPGFLLECLAWNAPNYCFTPTSWDERIQEIMLYLWTSTKLGGGYESWREVNDIKPLFETSQPWSREQTHKFLYEAWQYIGVRL